MAERRAVNVWFDRPGDFLDIGWSSRWSFNSYVPPDTELGIEVHLTDDHQATAFFILGALLFSDRCDENSTVIADVQPHPVTVKYDRTIDQWDVQWGPGAVERVDTPSPRVQAQVDASGDIQGVLISDLHSFEDEILNVDLYPVTPGTATA